MYVTPLRGLQDNNELFGHKAIVLSRLKDNFNVPDGFVITTKAFNDFVEKSGLRARIMNLLRLVDVNDKGRLQNLANEIQKLLVYEPMPRAQKSEIIDYYLAIGTNDRENSATILSYSNLANVAVRASPTKRFDVPFKLHLSFLNIRGEDRLINAIKSCWASLFTAKAIEMRLLHKIEDISMAVVVQKMVNTEVSGNICTVNPEKPSSMSMHAHLGLGEAMTCHHITSDNYIIDKATMQITDSKINNQQFMYVLDPRKEKTVKLEIPQEKSRAKKTDDLAIMHVAKIAWEIEKFFKKPQIVEFGIEDDFICIFESEELPGVELDKAATENNALLLGVEPEKKRIKCPYCNGEFEHQ